MKTILITGCNRGIGFEFVRQFSLMDINIIATYRNKSSSEELLSLAEKSSNIALLELDVSSNQSIEEFVNSMSEKPIDIYINNAGMMGSGARTFGEVKGDRWLEVFNVNTVAPLLLTQKLFGNFLKGKDKKLVYVSSKVGSIGDNSGGGSYIYRSSKTALNQVVKSLSIDLNDQGFEVVAVHPGWVQTDMGGPNAIIDVTTSVAGLINIITNLKGSDSGKFFNFDGQTIPW